MEQKKWYDNKLVVYLLLVIFFPIGLYGLWKSNSFSKGLKLVLTVIVAFLVILIGSNKKDKQIKKTPPTTVHKTEENSSKTVVEPKEITFQEYFLQQKATD